MSTQWVAGAGGVLGLNYAVLDFVMERCGVRKKKEKDSVFRDIRTLEESALDQMRINQQ